MGKATGAFAVLSTMAKISQEKYETIQWSII
jgi:hypothetical protein